MARCVLRIGKTLSMKQVKQYECSWSVCGFHNACDGLWAGYLGHQIRRKIMAQPFETAALGGLA